MESTISYLNNFCNVAKYAIFSPTFGCVRLFCQAKIFLTESKYFVQHLNKFLRRKLWRLFVYD